MKQSNGTLFHLNRLQQQWRTIGMVRMRPWGFTSDVRCDVGAMLCLATRSAAVATSHRCTASVARYKGTFVKLLYTSFNPHLRLML